MQSPTGSGKTVMIAHMIRTAADRGLTATFIVHRKELMEQTSEKLWALGVQHGVIAAGRTLTKDPVQVATIQTLARRVTKLPRPNLVVVDEAHHSVAPSYKGVLGLWKDAWQVGLTATPARTDGRGLSDMFDELVPGPSVAWLTERGYLAPYRAFAPRGPAPDLSGVHTRNGDYVREELEAVVDQVAIVGDAVDHYKRLVAPRSCLVYCVSRRHAHHVEEAYRAAGIDARYCAGDTEPGERRRIIEGLRRGDPPVVVSVDLFGEGLDAPGLAAVQLLRPTASLILHLQQIGRALRPEEGKEHAIILDHVGNIKRHGFPDDEREWTLAGRPKKKKDEEKKIALRTCDACLSIFKASLSACPHCGKRYVAQPSMGPEVVEGELKEITDAERKQQRMALGMAVARASTLEQLVEIAKRYKYKAAWAGIRWSQKTGEELRACIRRAQAIWRTVGTRPAPVPPGENGIRKEA